MEKKRIILAYSGGLDTSVILKWLLDKGHEVICYIADVGQDEDFDEARKKALTIGASKVYIEDLKEELVKEYIFTALKANAIYEGKYMLGTAVARPLIAKRQIEIAQAEGTHCVAHGATGKGNDQVRFELTYMTLDPEVDIISPWKDKEFLGQFQGRTDLIAYAKEHNIPISSTLEKPYSMDENIMHTSYEAGKLEDPSCQPPADMFLKTVSPQDAPDKTTTLTITFKKGMPVSVKNHETGDEFTDTLELYSSLNTIAGENGIGREDLVENRFIGMKSRGVYETPAATVLWKAHIDLEGLTLDKEVQHLKDQLMPKIAQIIYNGFWYSPEMEMLMAAIEKSQENVTGSVTVALYKGSITVLSRQSPYSLYDENIASMDIHGQYDQEHARGFITLNALRLKLGAKQCTYRMKSENLSKPQCSALQGSSACLRNSFQKTSPASSSSSR